MTGTVERPTDAQLLGPSKRAFFGGLLLRCALLFWSLFFLVLLVTQWTDIRWEWAYFLVQLGLGTTLFTLYIGLAFWRFRRRSKFGISDEWLALSSFSKGWRAADIGSGVGYLH